MSSRNTPVRPGSRPPASDEADAPTMLPGISAAKPVARTWTTFDGFYRCHACGIGTALGITLNDQELAARALNEAMARGLQRWRRVSTSTNPEAWVYRVGMNWAQAGRLRRRREHEGLLVHGAPAIPDQRLQQSIDGLSVDQRSVVVCRYFLDWSVTQTAEALDVGEGAVHTRLERALDHIRDDTAEIPDTEIEERLSGHLHRQDYAGLAVDALGRGVLADPDELRSIKRRSRQRSWRTRVGVAVGGLTLLAGAASLVPVRDDAGSLVAEPSPINKPTDNAPTDNAPTNNAPTNNAPTDNPAGTDTDTDSDFEPSNGIILGVPVSVPPGFEVVGDGTGGFVAFGINSTRRQVNFVRSDDGEQWFSAQSWQIPPDMRAKQLHFDNGLFIVELNLTDPRLYQYGNLSDQQLAVSRDLRSWHIIDLDLFDESGRITNARRRAIGDLKVIGDDIAIVALTIPQFDLDKYGLFLSQICGIFDSNGTTSAVLCDGGLVPIDDGDAVWPSGFEQQVLVSSNGDRAVERKDANPRVTNWREASGSILSLVSHGGEFAVIDSGQPATGLVPEELLTELDSDDITVVAAESRSEGSTLLTLRVDDTLVPIVLTADEATLGRFPDEAAAISGETIPPRITSGPAGWAVAIVDYGLDALAFERNGWQFRGVVGSESARLQSADGSEALWYSSNSTQLPPSVNLGLFGGVRYLHPETGEVLVEVTSDENGVPAELLEAAPPSAYVHTLTVDGWTLGGDPLRGPLTLTSPAGEVAQFSDGFAFDNDDISDGVETDIGSNALDGFVLDSVASISFYDGDGEELVSFRGPKIVQTLIAPVLGTTVGRGTYPVTYPEHFSGASSWVLFSTDGTDWDVIWSNPDGSAATVGNMVVGDNEVLLALPFNNTRIPLDD